MTSKNYLDSDAISMLNMLTTQFLDFAELRARRRQQITMAEWAEATNSSIQVNDMEMLKGAGRVSNDDATRTAHERFAAFDAQRRELEAARADAEAREDLRLLGSPLEADLLDELERVEDDIEQRDRDRRHGGDQT